MLLNDGWEGLTSLDVFSFKCGFCGNRVASQIGAHNRHHLIDGGGDIGRKVLRGAIRACTFCGKPTYFGQWFRWQTSGWEEIDEDREQIPGVVPGQPIEHMPDEVTQLYDEARQCFSLNAYTPAVLAFRKLLMHVAVDKGANQGQNFLEYVNYLDSKKYLGADGKLWVDLIRKKGNELNHEIVLMSEEDANNLLHFSGMLLKLVYEFPAMAKPSSMT